MSLKPNDLKGKITVHVRATAKPGKADNLEAAFAAVRERANSDAEPGTLTFHVSRFKNEFLLFETYENLQALDAHGKSPALANLGQILPECALGAPTVLFFEEIPNKISAKL